MAIVFLSYRRSDSPQACRVYDWLAQRMGEDAIFMDVTKIPSAVSFPEYTRQEVSNCKVLLALIGSEWQKGIQRPDDPVRIEIEAAIANKIPVLPVLIGNTPMPNHEELPKSISAVAFQNAVTVGVAHDFHTHMRSLIIDLDSILAGEKIAYGLINNDLIYSSCYSVTRFLEDQFEATLLKESKSYWSYLKFLVIGTDPFGWGGDEDAVMLSLHRVRRIAELLELHFILAFKVRDVDRQYSLLGWVIRQFERTPAIGSEYFEPILPDAPPKLALKIRPSDEDPRQIWKMITDNPLLLSLAYIGTIDLRSCV